MKCKFILLMLFVGGILLINCMGLIEGFGVSSRYWEHDGLILFPGESEDVTITVVSVDNESDMDIRAEIIEGSKVASLKDGDEVFLESGGTAEVKVRVKIPRKAVRGTRYPVRVRFRQISGGEEGTVSFNLVMNWAFDVVVDGELGEGLGESRGIGGSIWIYLLWALVLILGLVIIIVLLKFKKKERNWKD